jgi:hypothetical protein
MILASFDPFAQESVKMKPENEAGKYPDHVSRNLFQDPLIRTAAFRHLSL